jgi:carbon-monoxide dehydrogenase small subunit
VESLDVRLVVNGERHKLRVGVNESLLQVLRERLGLTGTKEGCAAGDCGACTVIMDGRAVLACLVMAFQADGRAVTTVEGLAEDGKLHPLQEAFVEHGAVQCGYCTPGMLMSAKALLDAEPRPDREAIRAALAGNLCRCTGYHQIIDAVAGAVRRPGKTGDDL